MSTKVYVTSGDLKGKVLRPHYPKDEDELVSVVKEAVDKHPHDSMELGTLMLISRKLRSHSEDDYWIASKSALKKAGFKVEKKKGDAKP